MENKTFWLVCLIILLISVIALLSGCAQGIVRDANGTERVKVNVFAWNFDLKKLVTDRVWIENFAGESEDVDVIVPPYRLKTGD